MRLHLRPGLTLELTATEAGVVAGMLLAVDSMLDPADPDVPVDDPVLARLFPAAYPEDEAAEQQYRDMTRQAAVGSRRTRLGQCAAELAWARDEDDPQGTGVVDLADPDDARRWLQALNDVRLAFGTRLGVTADGLPADTDPQAEMLYDFVSALQDRLVTAVMRRR